MEDLSNTPAEFIHHDHRIGPFTETTEETVSQDIITYSDEEGKNGKFNELLRSGQNLQGTYNRCIELATTIDKKWRKKRLMQIGMLEDLLGIIGISTIYTRTLENLVFELNKKLEAKNETNKPSEPEGEQLTPNSQ